MRVGSLPGRQGIADIGRSHDTSSSPAIFCFVLWNIRGRFETIPCPHGWQLCRSLGLASTGSPDFRVAPMFKGKVLVWPLRLLSSPVWRQPEVFRCLMNPFLSIHPQPALSDSQALAPKPKKRSTDSQNWKNPPGNLRASAS